MPKIPQPVAIFWCAGPCAERIEADQIPLDNLCGGCRDQRAVSAALVRRAINAERSRRPGLLGGWLR